MYLTRHDDKLAQATTTTSTNNGVVADNHLVSLLNAITKNGRKGTDEQETD